MVSPHSSARGRCWHSWWRLKAVGAEVWEPFTRNNQIDRTTPGWAYRIGQADLRDVRDADGLFAVVNGCPPDEGVMVELGLAVAWDKPVFLFRDDFSSLYRQRGLSAEPDGVHRPAGSRLAGLLVRLNPRDRRSRQGARPMVEGRRTALSVASSLRLPQAFQSW